MVMKAADGEDENDKYPLKDLGMNRVKKMADEAERLGINIAMENLNNIYNVAYAKAKKLEQIRAAGF